MDAKNSESLSSLRSRSQSSSSWENFINNLGQAMEGGQQTQIMSLIVSQLKSYGYYSLAKNVADQTGTFASAEPSNKLEEACKNIAIGDLQKEHGAVPSSVRGGNSGLEEGGGIGMVWDGKTNAKKVNPNYRTFFNTQHRGFARAVGRLFHRNLLQECSPVIIRQIGSL